MSRVFLNYCWSIVWFDYLYDSRKVILVKRWDCALIEDKYGRRQTISPCWELF